MPVNAEVVVAEICLCGGTVRMLSPAVFLVQMREESVAQARYSDTRVHLVDGVVRWVVDCEGDWSRRSGETCWPRMDVLMCVCLPISYAMRRVCASMRLVSYQRVGSQLLRRATAEYSCLLPAEFVKENVPS